MNYQRILSALFLIALLSSCTPTEAANPAQPAASVVNTITPTLQPSVTPTLTPTPTPSLPPMSDFMKGLVYYPAVPGGNQRPETDWILENIVLPTGANWIRLHLAVSQDNVESTNVYHNPEDEISDAEYIHLVETAHRLGLRVMSEHGINSSGWTNSWAGEIGTKYNEQQWAEWFDSYGKMILQSAQLAESAGTDYFIMASEFESTTHREKEWRGLIAKVRKVYHGKISMAYSEESSLQSVQFWDALDAIDVHPYYLDLPGVTDPTSEQLTQAFRPYADRLEALSKKWNKPILITEIGFWSVHTATQDYNNLDSSNQIDLQEQTDLFKAVFNTFYGKEWVVGIFWYAFEGSSNYAEPWNIHNDYIGKPAEDIIRSFYGALPMPTLTPVVFPEASLPTTETIYDDQLAPFWNNYPPEGDPANIQFDQSDIAVSGNAIKVKLQNFWTLDFGNPLIDWTKSQWLEFDLYVEPKDLPKVYTIGVSLRDASYQPSLFKVELLQSQFIEGGKIVPGTWQHVQIPLDVFGPMLSKYETISIDRPGHGSNTPMTIYVDNVILRGKSPENLSALSTKIPAVADASYYYDDFNDKTYDGGLNHILWSIDIPSSSAQAIQQDGVLLLSDKEKSNGQGIILSLSNWPRIKFGFLEARVMAHYENGSTGNITLDGISPELPRGWTEMGLTPRANGAKLHVIDLIEARVLNDTWYVLRIEYDEGKNALNYFIDGKQIASYVVPKKVVSLTPGIQLWHPEGGSVMGYIDYVAIGE